MSIQTKQPLTLPSDNLLNDWMLYFKNIKSPDSYITFGFYYMIAAAMQRRVWLGPCHKPIFPNLYIILTGDASVGKGLVITDVKRMLRYHKKDPLRTGLDEPVIDSRNGTAIGSGVKMDEETLKAYTEAINILDSIKQKQDDEEALSKIRTEEPLLLPMGPESVTFEELCQRMAKGVRRYNVPIDKRCALVPRSGIYTHNSMAFVLEELSSLFKKKAEKLVDFLVTVFDCGTYENSTKTAGTDYIKNTCLSLLAGTTPEFLLNTYADKLLNEGFSSRTIFVFAERSRMKKYGIDEYSLEQIEAYIRILAHLKNLSLLFGQCKLSSEAFEYMKYYFEKTDYVVNRNRKLKDYYGRKSLHADKLAMAVHFSRSYDLTITLDDCQTAVALLNGIEPLMHLALITGGETPMGRAAKKVFNLLKYNKDTAFSFNEIWHELEGNISPMELRETMDYLTGTGQVDSEGNDNWKLAVGREKTEEANTRML